tara:strand:- start:606 stop:827 length:222 start_codon:yes stop_codon:yes gene_type:complete
MALTDDERKEAIRQLKTWVTDYVSSEKLRLESERDFLIEVLKARSGGEYSLQVLNVESADAFVLNEINSLLGT